MSPRINDYELVPPNSGHRRVALHNSKIHKIEEPDLCVIFADLMCSKL